MPYELLGPSEFKRSKETCKAADTLNATITIFKDAESTYNADAEKFRSIPPQNLPDDFQEQAAELITRKVTLLRDELQVLTDLFPYFDLVRADQRAACEQARTEHQKATTEIYTSRGEE